MNDLFSGAHLHVLVNHAPVFGALFGVALLAASFLWMPDALRRTALVVLIATGVGGAAAYYSGQDAVTAIRGLPGVVRQRTLAHEDMAEQAFLIGDLVAVLAIISLLKWRREPVPTRVAGGMLLVSAWMMGAMFYTALLGGRVRHTEVRPGAKPADAALVEPTRERSGS